MIDVVVRACWRRGTLGLLAAALLTTSCHAPTTSTRFRDLGMGVRMTFTDPAEMGRQFDLMSRMKVDLVRVDFDWSAVETQQGQYDWSYPDQMTAQAAAHHMQVLALVTYSPSWARPPGTTSHAPPLDASAFAAFAQKAAIRYRAQGIKAWEVWNEPNSSDYWQPVPDVDRYGELFRATARAIRAVDGEATVITGGLTRGTNTPDRRRISQTTFVDGLYRNHTAQVADAIAVHPYSFPSLPTESGPVGGFSELPALHDLMQRWGDGVTKIWITEFGAPTGLAPDAMSEEDQAATVSEAMQMAQSWEWVGPLVLYELKDAGDDVDVLEQNFGVVRSDLSLKDAGKALTN